MRSWRCHFFTRKFTEHKQRGKERNKARRSQVRKRDIHALPPHSDIGAEINNQAQKSGEDLELARAELVGREEELVLFGGKDVVRGWGLGGVKRALGGFGH